MLITRRLLPCLLLLVLAACGGTSAPEAAPATASPEATPTEAATPPAERTAAPTEPGEGSIVRFLGPDGEELAFEVEVVADPPSRQRGLMERTELAEGTGMLFLFPEETAGGFWMMNTLIPLDIAYVAEGGDVVDVLQMEPCEEEPCEVYYPSGSYRHAVEVNAGALVDEGVDASWTAELPDDLPQPE